MCVDADCMRRGGNTMNSSPRTAALALLLAVLFWAGPLGGGGGGLARCLASDAPPAVVDGGDEYYDLEGMADEELEEICTSRGFELVREEGTRYTHRDYVDAAAECLQVESDL